MGNKNANPKRTPAQTSSSTVAAIGKLKKTQQTLEKRGTHLEAQMQGCLKLAKAKMAKKDKRGALFQLKKKKLLEKKLAGLENMQLNLESQIMTLETAKTNKDVVETMTVARDQMTVINKEINVDKIDDLQADLQDARDQNDTVTDILSTPLDDGMDDVDLESEFADLEKELNDERIEIPTLPVAPVGEPTKTPAVPVMPVAPVGDIDVSTPAEDEEELAALAAIMA